MINRYLAILALLLWSAQASAALVDANVWVATGDCSPSTVCNDSGFAGTIPSTATLTFTLGMAPDVYTVPGGGNVNVTDPTQFYFFNISASQVYHPDTGVLTPDYIINGSIGTVTGAFNWVEATSIGTLELAGFDGGFCAGTDQVAQCPAPAGWATSATDLSNPEVFGTLINGGEWIYAGTEPFNDDLLAPVPLPAAAWLFGSALLGLMTMARRKTA